MAEDRDDAAADDRNKQATERLEWIIAAFSSLIVLALVGYLAFLALTEKGGAPRLVLAVAETDESRPGYVLVAVSNEGEATAGDVQVEGTLPEGETAEVTLDYSPANSETPVTLVFSMPVQETEIALRIKGFTDP